MLSEPLVGFQKLLKDRSKWILSPQIRRCYTSAGCLKDLQGDIVWRKKRWSKIVKGCKGNDTPKDSKGMKLDINGYNTNLIRFRTLCLRMLRISQCCIASGACARSREQKCTHTPKHTPAHTHTHTYAKRMCIALARIVSQSNG